LSALNATLALPQRNANIAFLLIEAIVLRALLAEVDENNFLKAAILNLPVDLTF
jgi:hypothetical protein